MAKEYQRTQGGTLQWRDKSAGVDGWNNIDRDEEPAGQRQAAQPPPAPAQQPTPQPAPAAAPAAAAMSGLANAAPSPAATPMPTFSPITGGGGAPTSQLMGNAPPTAGAAGSGAIMLGGMEPGPGFVEGGEGAGALRGLGQRRPPETSMALAGLSRAY